MGSRAEASNVRGGKEDGQFGPPNVLTEDIPTYWATEDGVRQATLELRLPANETFNVVRLQVGSRLSPFPRLVMTNKDWLLWFLGLVMIVWNRKC